jgi:hypothetical protein
MILIQQPPKSEICVHCCVAMISGRPLNHILAYMGHWKACSLDDARNLLLKLGYRCGPVMLGKSTNILPQRCIIRTHNRKKRVGHTSVMWDGKHYDPSPNGNPLGRVTHFLEIFSEDSSVRS